MERERLGNVRGSTFDVRGDARFLPLTRGAILVLALASWFCVDSVRAAGVIREGPRSCRSIALTFDLCPVREGPGYDTELIRTLVEKHIPATFFLSGRWMAKHDEQVRDLLTVPFFEVGTHGHVHAHLPELNEGHQQHEIEEAVELLSTRYHRAAPLFRPPYGEYNETTVKIVDALGLRFILWSIVSGDPDPQLSREQIVERVISRARNGSIVVMHANGKGRHTREVVEDLYARLIVQQQYRAVTVSTLLEGCPVPGHDDRRSDR